MNTLLEAIRAIILELKIGLHDWPFEIPCIITALNEASYTRLGKDPDGGYRCSLQVITGLRPVRSYLLLVIGHDKGTSQDRGANLMSIDKMHGF